MFTHMHALDFSKSRGFEITNTMEKIEKRGGCKKWEEEEELFFFFLAFRFFFLRFKRNERRAIFKAIVSSFF